MGCAMTVPLFRCVVTERAFPEFLEFHFFKKTDSLGKRNFCHMLNDDHMDDFRVDRCNQLDDFVVDIFMPVPYRKRRIDIEIGLLTDTFKVMQNGRYDFKGIAKTDITPLFVDTFTVAAEDLDRVAVQLDEPCPFGASADRFKTYGSAAAEHFEEIPIRQIELQGIEKRLFETCFRTSRNRLCGQRNFLSAVFPSDNPCRQCFITCFHNVL